MSLPGEPLRGFSSSVVLVERKLQGPILPLPTA